MSHVPRARPLSKPSLSPPWQPECTPCLPPPQSRWGQSSQAGSPAQNPHTGHSQQIWGADLHEGDNRCLEVLVFLRRGSPRTRPLPGETAGQRGDARERESSKSHPRVAVFPAGWPLIPA